MSIFKPILASFVGALVFGLVLAGVFVVYGGNHCDQPPASTCECFCCHSFSLRGYEACARFGLYFGISLGGLIGLFVERQHRPGTRSAKDN